MHLILTCPCQKKLKISDDKRGKQIKCPACHRILKVPERKTESKTDDSLWGELPSAQTIQPHANGNNNNVLNPSRVLAQQKATSSSGRTLVLVLGSLGACMVLASVAGMALWLRRDSTIAQQSETAAPAESVITSNPGTASNLKVETPSNQSDESNEVGGFVPSIPNAILKWPKPVLENAAFDILEFVKAPPANENAAPLYLDALFEFSPELEACFAGAPDLAEHLNVIKERVKKRKVFDKPYSPENAAEWKNALKPYEEGFNKMVLAQKRPKCMFSSDYRFFPRSPQGDGAYWFGKTAVYRSTVNLRDGDFLTPLQTVEMILRLSRDLRKPNKSSHGGNDVLEENVESIIREMFLTQGLKSEHCDQLLSSLDRHIQILGDDTLSMLQGDYVIQRLFVYELLTKTGFFSLDRRREFAKGNNVAGDNSAEDIFAWLAYTVNPKGPQGNRRADMELIKTAAIGMDLKREYGFVDQVFQKNIAMAKRPFAERWSETYYSRDSIYKEGTKGELELDMSKFYLARPAMLCDRFAIYEITKARTKLNALKALVALRKWQLKHREAIPTTLEEVMKDSGYPVMPIDGFSNKPLLFTVLSGTPVIYSVGPNGVDEQAKIEANFYLSEDVWYLKATPMQSPGDFIFRIGN